MLYLLQFNSFVGLTEIATIATLQNKGQKNHNSCGVLCYDLEMKIVDVTTKKILGPNEKGEIYFKQEYMMDKYYNNPEATAEAIDKDGSPSNNPNVLNVHTTKFIHFYFNFCFLNIALYVPKKKLSRFLMFNFVFAF